MKIQVGGMPQAGSTLCFNLLKFALQEEHNLQLWVGSRKMGYIACEKETDSLIDLVKVHVRTTSNFLINVRRDIRDSVASNIRKDPEFAGGDVLKIAARNMTWYNQCNPCDYLFCYEEYKARPVEVAKEMLESLPLAVECDIEKVIEKAESLKDKKYSSKLTHHKFDLMTSHHVTNGGKIGSYRETLDTTQISLLELEYGVWLLENGYKLCV
jgi:hypothetical protein